MAQVVLCPVPTVSAVSPNVRTAGQSYPVTITGQNFVTTAAAATTNCPVSTVYVQTPTTSPDVTVAVSGISVVSATEITATVEATSAPYTGPALKGGTPAPAGAIAATVEVIATPPAQSGPAPAVAAKVVALDATTAPTPNVDVLIAPQILWNDNVISGGASAASAVVGQTITLSTTPSATTLANLPIPLYFTSRTWTAPGTIGGYPIVIPSSPTSTVSSASVIATVPSNPGLIAYWLYPRASVPVTYSYCASTSISDTADQKCGGTATANFNVTGPTASIASNPPSTSAGTAAGAWWVSDPYSGCTMNDGQSTQFLVFGAQYPAPATCTLSPVLISGIAFEATGISLAGVTAPKGVFQWVQIITGGQLTGAAAGKSVVPFPQSLGLDASFPYQAATPTTTNDSPAVGLQNTLTTSETRAFTAQMYLMWNSNLDSASINVPIGYVTWSITGTADQNASASPPWSLDANQGTTTATYTQSTDTGAPNHGLPVWSANVPTGATSSNQSESVAPDGEEENKQ